MGDREGEEGRGRNMTKQDGNGTTDGASRQGPGMGDIRLGLVVFFGCVCFF